MKVNEHSYEVSKFIKFLKDANSRRNNKEYDTATIFRFALNEYKLKFWAKVFLFVFLSILAFASFFFFKERNIDLAEYLFLEILLIEYGIVIYFPKLIPNPGSYYNIKFKIENLDKIILRRSEIDYDLIKIILLNETFSEDKNYFEFLYLKNIKERVQELKNIDQVLLSIFYLLKKKLELKIDDEELGYLLGIILKSSEHKIRTERFSILNRYNKITDDADSDKLKKMKSELELVKEIYKESIKLIEQDQAIIDIYLSK